MQLIARLTGADWREPRLALPAAAELGVHREDHRADAVDAVGRHEVDRLRPLPLQEHAEGPAQGAAAQAPCQRLIEDGELGVKARGGGMRPQQACAEAVECPEESGLGVTRRLAFAELEQPRPDPLAQLSRRSLGEGDRQDLSRREPVLADRPDEALHQHEGLPAASGRRQEQVLRAASGRELLLLGERPALAGHGRIAHGWHLQMVGYMHPPR